MTLSTEIAALTGDEDAATLRAIDARVAVLLGWTGEALSHVDAPAFTTSLDATLAEIRRRGWSIRCCLDPDQSDAYIWSSNGDKFGSKRDGNNHALAALEALVRAVEGQGK